MRLMNMWRGEGGERGGKVREWDNMGDGGKIKNYKERQRSGEKVTQEKYWF